MCGLFPVLPNFSGRFPMEYVSHRCKTHESSSKTLRRSQQFSRIFQQELYHPLDLGSGRTQPSGKHLDALRRLLTPSVGVDMIAKCLATCLCENHRND